METLSHIVETCSRNGCDNSLSLVADTDSNTITVISEKGTDISQPIHVNSDRVTDLFTAMEYAWVRHLAKCESYYDFANISEYEGKETDADNLPTPPKGFFWLSRETAANIISNHTDSSDENLMSKLTSYISTRGLALSMSKMKTISKWLDETFTNNNMSKTIDKHESPLDMARKLKKIVTGFNHY